MSLLIALWLAVLGAIGAYPAGQASVVSGRLAHVGRATAPTLATRGTNGGATRATPRERRLAGRTLGEPTVRAERTASGHGPGLRSALPPLLAEAPRLSGGADLAAAVRARTLEDSHAVAARGALLPYYPTAPPLQS